MKWLLDFPTRAKLLLCPGMLVAFLLAGVLISLRAMAHLESSHRRLIDHEFVTVLALAEMRDQHERQHILVLKLLGTAGDTERRSLLRQIEAGSAALDVFLRESENLLRDDPSAAGALAKLKQALTDYRSGLAQQLELLQAGRREEARALAEGEQGRRIERVAGAQDELYALAKKTTATAANEAAELVQKTQTMLGGGALLTLVLGLGLALVLARSIARPLRHMARTAEQMAAGNLTLALNERDLARADEVGALARSMAQLADGLREQIRQLAESVSVLNSSASQISSSTSQLAANSAQTAAAVSETSATVEELRQTAVVASQKARGVSDLSQRGADVAEAGRRSVEETLGGMQRIRAQMELIAERMVRLNEQSQSIGQIVTSVEELAAQSNMLAVNAGIEAAKAGEHGRGFMVVAQEMRSLAEQSRQATVQVMAILTEIQKAASAAALATEQGGRAVESGVTQATQTGQSIQSLAANVTDSAAAAAQIAASSQEQLIGVGQVATSMEGVKQATLQNAAGARQLEAAARNLNQLGERLQGYVRRYRL